MQKARLHTAPQQLNDLFARNGCYRWMAVASICRVRQIYFVHISSAIFRRRRCIVCVCSLMTRIRRSSAFAALNALFMSNREAKNAETSNQSLANVENERAQ